ncbi:MAG: alpha/beta hydrolase [Lysobacterales bacterium]
MFSVLLALAILLCGSCASQVVSQSGHGLYTSATTEDPAIHYVEIGSGPPVILIPGLFSTHAGWNRTIPYLLGHHRILAIDNFGTGSSDRNVTGFDYSVAEQADKVIAFMDELKIERCDLVGISYGGMIALNIAARYPQRVNSIVSIEGAVIMPRKDHYERLIQGLKFPPFGNVVIGFIRSGLFDERMAKGIMEPSWADLNPEDQAEITAIIARNSKAATRRTWLSLARALTDAEDFTEEAKGIKAPVLYLSGDLSEFRDMTDRNIVFFKEYLPAIQVVSFADGVHDLELQKPEQTAALILEFIEQNADGLQVVESVLH